MLKLERQEKIIKILEEKRFATIDFLTTVLYSSAPTIRRDLNELKTKGLIKRSHGGAMIVDSENLSIPIDFRNKKNIYEKIQICKKAVHLIKENYVVFIDGSTTNLHLADCIPESMNITVVTNSLQISLKMCEKNIKTYCTGGILIPDSRCFAGRRAESFVEDFCGDIFFFSSCAIDKNGKITDYSDTETALRKKMLKNSKLAVFMCDSSKFDKKSSFNVTDLDSIDYIVTDIPFEKSFKAKNIY